ncbi:MAG: bifunctional 2-polyprenyl-6-hydroxyphenol methylase/3-demethylubiquinol 3-O-methyltransferase UbiG [Magnetococcales bacterium]|nr:bifunctional 2-polyprenyl-6-hydroxyphenol methylase/3-demethylubiquinol 3-O-methyltransferase UbiG [Magnetococcales bacterium]
MATEDPSEIRKFEEMAHEWWEPEGKFKPLHQINPLRLGYIRQHLTGSPRGDMSNLRLLDIGCGGGILSEALSQAKAEVVGIDRSERIIGIAKAHQRESHSNVDYRVQSVEELSQQEPASFDGVMAMEVLEHVPDPELFLNHCAQLLKPGAPLFFATLNRTLRSYLLAIIGAEYVLQWLPKGTHQHEKFIRPSEIKRYLDRANVTMVDLCGMSYHPLKREWSLGKDTSVNFLGYGTRLPL